MILKCLYLVEKTFCLLLRRTQTWEKAASHAAGAPCGCRTAPARGASPDVQLPRGPSAGCAAFHQVPAVPIAAERELTDVQVGKCWAGAVFVREGQLWRVSTALAADARPSAKSARAKLLLSKTSVMPF